MTERYLRGDEPDQLFARIDVNGTTETPYWYLTDWQGSVRNLVDDSGNIDLTVTYDAYGNITSETGSVALGRYAWTGRELDTETGLQYNRARYYDPTTGRWISQDPMGFSAGDGNLYRYARNQATTDRDPSGLQDVPIGSIEVADLADVKKLARVKEFLAAPPELNWIDQKTDNKNLIVQLARSKSGAQDVLSIRMAFAMVFTSKVQTANNFFLQTLQIDESAVDAKGNTIPGTFHRVYNVEALPWEAGNKVVDPRLARFAIPTNGGQAFRQEYRVAMETIVGTYPGLKEVKMGILVVNDGTLAQYNAVVPAKGTATLDTSFAVVLGTDGKWSVQCDALKIKEKGQLK